MDSKEVMRCDNLQDSNSGVISSEKERGGAVDTMFPLIAHRTRIGRATKRRFTDAQLQDMVDSKDQALLNYTWQAFPSYKKPGGKITTTVKKR